MSWLGALRQLDLDHPHLRFTRVGDEALLVEAAIVVATAEVAGTDLPHQVAAVLAVVGRDRALAGIVIETAAFSTGVERADRVRRQRAEAHRRDVEHAGVVRLHCSRTDADAEVVRGDLRRRDRVVDPFVIDAVHVLHRAERHHVGNVLRALIHQCTLLTRERHLGGIAFDEVLPHLRPDRLQPVAEVREDRIVAPQRAAPLQQVPGAEQRQRAEDRDAPAPFILEREPRRGYQRHRHAGGVDRVSRHAALLCGTALTPRVVPGVGIEPTWPCGRGILSRSITLLSIVEFLRNQSLT